MLFQGYPCSGDTSQPSIAAGVLEGYHTDMVHYIGSQGARVGCVGGPIISECGSVCGVAMGSAYALSLNHTFRQVMNGLAEQQNILPFQVVEACSMHKGSFFIAKAKLSSILRVARSSMILKLLSMRLGTNPSPHS